MPETVMSKESKQLYEITKKDIKRYNKYGKAKFSIRRRGMYYVVIIVVGEKNYESWDCSIGCQRGYIAAFLDIFNIPYYKEKED